MKKFSWSNKYEECLSCNTNLFKHKAKGLCLRCYPIKQQIAIVKNWDETKPITLRLIKGMKSWYFDEIKKDKQYNFGEYKKHLIEELERNIFPLKHLGKVASGEAIDGLQLETLFNRIADLSHTYKRNLFDYDANIFSENFNSKQRNLIYQLLF